MMTRFFAFTVVMGACAVSALPSAPIHSFWSAASHAPGTWTRLGEKVGCALSRTQMRLRGGAAEVQEEEAAPKPAGFAAQLYIALKDNKSLDPNDHPSSFQWMLTGLNVRSSLRSCCFLLLTGLHTDKLTALSNCAVLLAAYIAVGAPLKEYVPGLRELATVEPKEVPLTQAQLDRTEREMLRKEMEEEYEQTLMEDTVKESERKAKQDKIDAAQHAQEEAVNAKNSALSGYAERIEAIKGRITTEPADGVLLRLRCPDGHQLTRKFAKDSPVGLLYDYIDLERYTKASKVACYRIRSPPLNLTHTLALKFSLTRACARAAYPFSFSRHEFSLLFTRARALSPDPTFAI